MYKLFLNCAIVCNKKNPGASAPGLKNQLSIKLY